MGDYFAMGGYAAYVWPAYAAAGIILVVLLAVSLRGLHDREAVLKALEDARPHRRRTAPRPGSRAAAETTQAPAAEGGEG
jgi:heme exporter protein D